MSKNVRMFLYELLFEVFLTDLGQNLLRHILMLELIEVEVLARIIAHLAFAFHVLFLIVKKVTWS